MEVNDLDKLDKQT